MHATSVHIKESIVFSAIDLVHERGAYAVSTKEIAKRLGVAESTIFKHFPRKADLLRAVLEQFSLYDRDLFQTARSTRDPAAALHFYIETLLGNYESYPALAALVPTFALFRSVPELADQARAIELNRWAQLHALIEAAQAVGFLLQSINPGHLTDALTSVVDGMCAKWHSAGCRFPLRTETMAVVNLLVAAFSPANPA